MIKKQVLLTTALALCIATASVAQTGQVSVSGSYLKGTGGNNASLWGGGIAGKGFIGNNVALGVILQTYPESESSEEINGFRYTTADLLTNVSGTLDFLLNPKSAMVQPYIGIDGGVSWNNSTVTYTNQNDQYLENRNKNTFFLLSPKVGVNIGLGQAFGIFGQARYNFTFGDGKTVSIENVPVPFESKSVTEFINVDAGIYFRFMPAR